MPANMYGLPKIHKLNIPLRPIISSRGAPSYLLAKWVSGILTPLLGIFSKAHVRNNMDFMNKIKNVSFSHGKMVSYNVASLFTKVDLSCTLDFLSRKLPEFYPTELPLPVNVFIDLIRLCVNDNVFTYNGKFYQQTFGCAMGFPLPPVLSNFFIEYFECELLPTILQASTSWLRYVDDVFSVCTLNNNDFEMFFQWLNELRSSITSTFEWENNNILSLFGCFDNLQMVQYFH